MRSLICNVKSGSIDLSKEQRIVNALDLKSHESLKDDLAYRYACYLLQTTRPADAEKLLKKYLPNETSLLALCENIYIKESEKYLLEFNKKIKPESKPDIKKEEELKRELEPTQSQKEQYQRELKEKEMLIEKLKKELEVQKKKEEEDERLIKEAQLLKEKEEQLRKEKEEKGLEEKDSQRVIRSNEAILAGVLASA